MVTSFISANLANECFFMVSSFLTAYKCFQIMEARKGDLTIFDYAKIILRKFFRLAPAYYGMWMIMWVAQSRTGDGPIWHITNMNFETCKDDWYSTFFWHANLSKEMVPYSGCYSFAWPLQVDMQITLFVPLLVNLYFKMPNFGFLVCVLMICLNAQILIALTEINGFKIGMMSTNNFWFFNDVFAKPWTKLHDIGFGTQLAYFYLQILKFRSLPKVARELQFPKITSIHQSKFFGPFLLSSAGLILTANLFFAWPYNTDPMASSDTLNEWYQAISRISFPFAFMLILIAVFTNHANRIKAFFSSSNAIFLSKSFAIGCVLEIFCIQYLFCSREGTPEGIYITFPVCLLFGLGFMLTTWVLSIIIVFTLEFPVTRIYQLLLLPYLSHDQLLKENYNMREIAMRYYSPSRMKEPDSEIKVY